MKIKIINHSGWRTDDLRRMFRAACKAAGATGDKVLEVRDGRAGYVRGRAVYGQRGADGVFEGRFVWMWIPSRVLFQYVSADVPEGMTQEAAGVARVFVHEVLHTLGVTHGEMTNAQRHCTQPIPWAAGLVLRRKEEKPKPEPESKKETPAERGARIREEREKKARKMLERAERDQKRAAARVRKWKKKVRYYERQMKQAAGRSREK